MTKIKQALMVNKAGALIRVLDRKKMEEDLKKRKRVERRKPNEEREISLKPWKMVKCD